MSGPVAVMASMYNDTNTAFHRSASSSNLPTLPTPDFAPTPLDSDGDLPRSASYTYLPTLGADSFTPDASLIAAISAEFLPADDGASQHDDRSTETTCSSTDKPKSQDSPPTSRSGSPESSPDRTSTDTAQSVLSKAARRLSKAPSKPRGRAATNASVRTAQTGASSVAEGDADDVADGRTLERVGRQKSFVTRPKSWIQRRKTSPERKATPEPKEDQKDSATGVPTLIRPAREKSKTRAGALASLARKSWISTSRSPSPSSVQRRGRQGRDSDDSVRGSATRSPARPAPAKAPERTESVRSTATASDAKDRSRSLSRRSTLLLGRSKRPQSMLVAPPETTAPVVLPAKLPKSTVVPTLDISFSPRSSSDVPPVPKSFALEKLQSLGDGRRRDELWSAFRALESDYQKFQSKSSALKTNVVRATLLPFLKSHTQHPSNMNLRPEDLDRRVSVLNKWWIGLLELLHGHNGQAISGVDRPLLLDALTGIMTRPEWRLTPNPPAGQSTQSGSGSSTSLSSASSNFVAESIYHNVRNMFTQNLLMQMSMVVEKMSLRHAPASLVNFCGKAAAYAFFFCPGVADALVRIWSISAETLRRVVDEFGLPRRVIRGSCDTVLESFPPYLHHLAYTSMRTLMAELHRKPNLPLGAAQISWKAPWVGRFRGRDSDLFFVFAKHYHILVEELLPPNLSFVEKVRAPGFAIVQAQLLAVLDQTIHRPSSGEAAAAPPPLTFDDVLLSAEASAAALPLPTSNVTRLMAENRLIMLLRDFLSERPTEDLEARETFAQAFPLLLSATAQRISLFDHMACFVLCDFAEEALFIVVRYQQANLGSRDFINWKFWLEVCKRMLSSQNTMSEIRLVSFIYSVWNIVTSDENRKRIVTLEWLLSEEVFMSLFNHWSPMVRAYYMRLLCWRLCRFTGETSTTDLAIYSTVLERLNTVWANYLYIRETAEKEKKLLPSIMPSPPAPGRRILIIRNDNQTPPSGLFLGFDGLMAPRNQPAPFKRHSLAGLGKIEQNESKARTERVNGASGKKRWSILGKINPFAGTDSDGAPRLDGDAQLNSRKDASGLGKKDEHQPFSFKFSLEWNPPPQVTVRRARPIQFSAPRLPGQTQNYVLENTADIAKDIPAKKPNGNLILRAKYSGRALAEWGFVVHECNNFVDRRKAEGVPSLKLIEVPTLSVDGIRKFG